jgi:hypothetical protein
MFDHPVEGKISPDESIVCIVRLHEKWAFMYLCRSGSFGHPSPANGCPFFPSMSLERNLSAIPGQNCPIENPVPLRQSRNKNS